MATKTQHSQINEWGKINIFKNPTKQLGKKEVNFCSREFHNNEANPKIFCGIPQNKAYYRCQRRQLSLSSRGASEAPVKGPDPQSLQVFFVTSPRPVADGESGVETKPALGALPATGGKESLLGLCTPKEAVFFYFLRNSLIPERQSIKKGPSHSAEHFCARFPSKGWQKRYIIF